MKGLVLCGAKDKVYQSFALKIFIHNHYLEGDMEDLSVM